MDGASSLGSSAKGFITDTLDMRKVFSSGLFSGGVPRYRPLSSGSLQYPLP